MPLQPLQPDDPASLGEYQLQGRLGAGGMGVVYLGFGADRDPVAIKTLTGAATADARTRIRREAELLSAVTSPHVAGYVAADTEASPPWIALAYVPGPTLAEVQVPLTDVQLRQLAQGLADGLGALHNVGIIHRDVKPGNIVLTFAGPVLVDLGIARTQDMTSMTQAGTAIGSPAWMAPEQLRGETLQAPTDIWGWGAVLAYAATGRPPFGDGPIEALAWRIQHQDVDLDDVPEWLLGQVTAALAKDPTARPPAGSLVGLLPATEQFPRSHNPAEATKVSSTESADQSDRPKADHPYRRRRRKVAIAVAIGMVVVAVTGAVLLLSGDRNPGPTDASGKPPTTERNTTASALPSAPSSAWPSPGQDTVEAPVAVPHGTELPPFPETVTGYSLADSWKTTVRAFTGDEWSILPEFPSTMNGCDLQRFYVRWRALNTTTSVEATFLSTPDEIVLTDPALGGAGWMSGYGCGQPAFRMKSSDGEVTLTDVVVEVQRWEPSV